MDLRQFIHRFKRYERAPVITAISEETGRSEVAVRSWISGKRGIPPECLPGVRRAVARFRDKVVQPPQA
jgi:hypothetical protein